MITFKCQHSEHEGVELTISGHSSLCDVLEAFRKFLVAAGYCIDGDVIIEETKAEVIPEGEW